MNAAFGGLLLAVALAAPLPGQSVGTVEWSGPPSSGKPFLTATGGGGLLLTWFEPRAANRYALQVATRVGGTWTKASTVAESDQFFVNWADFPSIAEAGNGTWTVHWLERTAPKSYAYHVRVARSKDRGRTWSAPVTLHRDRSPTEHGFVAMVPNVDGSVAAAWLDGQAMVDSTGSMSVRTVTIGADGQLGDETVLDARSCECCQVAMTRAASGLIAAYRDRSAEEVRDIVVVRQRGGRWLDPVPVGRDNWVWRACPVNGPSLAAKDNSVAVAWYTAAGDTPRVKVAFSGNGGDSFGTAIVADDGKPLGRTHLQMVAPTSAALVWLETRSDNAEWRIRRVSASGRIGASRVLGATVRTREAGFPRSALVGDDLFTAWTAPGDKPTTSQVKVTRVSIRALP